MWAEFGGSFSLSRYTQIKEEPFRRDAIDRDPSVQQGAVQSIGQTLRQQRVVTIARPPELSAHRWR